MVIDFQIHWIVPELAGPHHPENKPGSYIQPDGSVKRYSPKEWSEIDKLIEFIDASGIDLAVVSVMDGMKGDIKKCRIVNDRLKWAEERHPGKIMGYAHVPPFGDPEAFAELKRCKDELGFKAACMFTVCKGVNLDDKKFWPFYEKLCELEMPLFIHPSIEIELDYYPDYDLARSVAREGHLQTALVRLINGGVLDDFPTLKVIFAHLGGGIAANLARQISYQDKEFWLTAGDPRNSRKCKRDFQEYLGEMYFDSAGIIADIDAVKMALMKIPPRSIVFGTDYPYEIRDPKLVQRFIKDFRDLPYSKEENEGMLSGTGRKLLGI